MGKDQFDSAVSVPVSQSFGPVFSIHFCEIASIRIYVERVFCAPWPTIHSRIQKQHSPRHIFGIAIIHFSCAGNWHWARCVFDASPRDGKYNSTFFALLLNVLVGCAARTYIIIIMCITIGIMCVCALSGMLRTPPTTIQTTHHMYIYTPFDLGKCRYHFAQTSKRNKFVQHTNKNVYAVVAAAAVTAVRHNAFSRIDSRGISVRILHQMRLYRVSHSRRTVCLLHSTTVNTYISLLALYRDECYLVSSIKQHRC